MAQPKVNLSDKFKFGATLGKGSFATVVVATEVATGTSFAMKVIDKARCRGQEDHIVKEITILKKIQHPNIVQLFDVFETRDKLYLQMEYVTGGELFDRIVNRGNYTEQDARGIIRSILQAVDYLHKQSIVHRDLKPENLLMSNPASVATEGRDDAEDVKLADFGLATVAESDVMLKTACGTLTYVAPEILRQDKYGKPVDMWSIGVITYILLCGYPPFWAEDDAGVLELTLKGKYKFFSPEWDAISSAAKDFVSKLIVLDPAKRLTSEQALQHPWMATPQPEGAMTPLAKVSDNLVKNFNAKRKLRSAIQAVMAASMTKSTSSAKSSVTSSPS